MQTYINPLRRRTVHLGIEQTASGDWYAWYSIPSARAYEIIPATSRAHAQHLRRIAANIAWQSGYINLPLLTTCGLSLLIALMNIIHTITVNI